MAANPNRKKPILLCLGPQLGLDFDLLRQSKGADINLCPLPVLMSDVKKDPAMILWTSGTTGKDLSRHI